MSTYANFHGNGGDDGPGHSCLECLVPSRLCGFGSSFVPFPTHAQNCGACGTACPNYTGAMGLGSVDLSLGKGHGLLGVLNN